MFPLPALDAGSKRAFVDLPLVSADNTSMEPIDPNEMTTLKLKMDAEHDRPLPPGVQASVEIAGSNPPRAYRLVKVPTIFGRANGCEVRISDTEVSRQHARIEYSNGRFHIADMGSTNGTFLNEARVVRSPLKNGDLIGVGKHRFVFRTAEPGKVSFGTPEDQATTHPTLRRP